MDAYIISYLLLLIAIVFSVVAQIKVNTTFSEYSKKKSKSALTGAEVARQILDAKGLYSVSVEPIRGNLTDHFDPRQNVVRLSENVYGSTSVAAIGVASHECGHAIQHAEDYSPLVLRSRIVGITNICSRLSFGLIFAGILIDIVASTSSSLGYLLQIAGILAFAVVTFFQLVTLPVEFNASARALDIISNRGILSKDELSGARKVLSAAAMTYLAALAVSLANLLRFALIVSGNSRRRN